MLYTFLAAVVVYCLIQSVRFRLARLQHRTSRPDLSQLGEEAWLTEKGRALYRKHRFYDTVGLMAAIALLMIWASDSGVLEAVLGALS